MTTTLLEPTGTATIDTSEVDIEGGASTLDSSAVPYAAATLDLPLLDDALLEWLDPRDGVRVPYEAGLEGGTQRPFDLGLRARSVDHKAKKVTLTLASDEALLIDYKSLTTDSGARAHETSLRAVCNYVLAKIGAALEPGADDANVTAYWAVTNMLPNPVFGTGIAGWSTGFGASALTRVANGNAPSGWALRWTATAATSAIVAATGQAQFRVDPGRTYVFEIDAYGGAARTASARLQWFSSDGTVLIGEVAGASQVLDITGVFKRFTVMATAPAGATTMQPILFIHNTANGEAFITSGGILYEGNEIIPPFHGGTPATSTYTYAWSGTPHASPSARTPVIERRPELFTWKPGTSAWDFLLAITASAGLVLWCDELRKWRLAAPENRTIVELVAVTASTTRDGTDEINLDDEDTTPTGVVVIYRWRDSDGIEREAVDSAGTPERVVTIVLNKPYPGPGTASAILARRQGSGRRQSVTVISQMNTTPGMTAQISLPGAPDTVGRVAAVTFDHATGFMDLGSAGLIDILPGSIDALEGSIDALVGTIDSL